MKSRITLISLVTLLALVASSAGTPRASPAAPWQAKVDPWVIDTAADGETEFLVFLEQQADLSGAQELETKLEKGRYVFERLTEVAERTQGPVLEALATSGVEYRPFWIANMVWVRGDMQVIQAMAQRSDVARVFSNPTVRLEAPEPTPSESSIQAINSIEWNISKIRAPEVWEAGYTGQGVVIGGQDTGYEWSHPAIKNKYRGWNGISADHNYNWHDAIHDSVDNWLCGNNASEPCDDHGHGTHTMGIAVGADAGLSNQIGVAPGARWIGCRNMDSGVGTPATYSECYQWFLAPTDLRGEHPDPSLAPDVINNSWGCTLEEGCTDPEILLEVVEVVRAAGIITVHSAGNSGPGCSTVDTPAAIYDASFTVGNTTSSDLLSSSSSRGPVTVDGSGRMKPDIAAPGTGIRSSITGGSYTTLSGTSMSAPHVAGLVALLLSAQPLLRGQVDEIERLIEGTAVHLNTTQVCGGTPGTQAPNNIYGWGRIDAWSALQGNALSISVTASDTKVAPGEALTYTLTVRHTAALNSTTNVVVLNEIPANTTFLDATPPYEFNGDSVRWEFSSLEPNESRSVDLVVQVLPGYTGTIENAQYSAYSDQVTRAVIGEPVQTEVVEAFGVTLSPEYSGVTWMGGEITYTHSLVNIGSNTDVYDLTFSSMHDWGEPFDYELVLGPGEGADVTVTFRVPEDAPIGSVDSGSLVVASHSQPSLTASVTDTTAVGRRYLFPFIEQEP